MVNSTHHHMLNDVSIGALKAGHLIRRPFQPRNVNEPSAPSSAKSTTTTKPQMNNPKSRPENTKKMDVVSENVSEWPAIDDEAPTPFFDSEPEMSIHQSIFRRRTGVDDEDEQDVDMFVLKRANPVYDSEDDHYTASPSKRQRTTERAVLHWSDQLSDDEDGNFSFSILPTR